MDGVISKITETASEAIKKAGEMMRERLFSPMYFSFIIAWVIANWKFVYTLLFVDEKTIFINKQMIKLDYLSQMYQLDFWSIAHLLLIPALSSFIIVWWLSLLSLVFFRKHEERQMEKRSAKSEIEYRERVWQANSERKMRENELEYRAKYEDNRDFNDWLDEQNEKVSISGDSLLPSEALYNTDYQAYKDQLNNWMDDQARIGEDMAVQQEVDRRSGK